MSLFQRTPSHHENRGNLRAQFALGISLGLMIGLLPKDSILPWAIGLVTLLLPVNLGATVLAVVAGSFLGLTLDPVAHPIGETVLANQTVQANLSRLSDAPGFAWAQLNNTVVMGLTTIGFLASIPVYLSAHALYRETRSVRDAYPIVHPPTLQES